MAFKRTTHTRGPQRKSLWVSFVPVSVSHSGGTEATLVASLNAAALALRPFTVVRTHFELMLISDQAAAVEVQIGSVGVAIVSDQASAIGVTAIPTPITDLGSSLWFLNKLLFANQSNVVDKALPGLQVSIDSKAMRKVELGQDLVVAIETGSISAGVVYKIGGRVLIKTN